MADYPVAFHMPQTLRQGWLVSHRFVLEFVGEGELGADKP